MGPATATPAASNHAAPPPARGCGSGCAITTRAIPAANNASVHGGVRPWWAQGSRVTTAVAPWAAAPAAARATTSPCRPGGGSVTPSPTTRPSASTMQPTAGLGLTCGWARAASASAARSTGVTPRSDPARVPAGSRKLDLHLDAVAGGPSIHGEVGPRARAALRVALHLRGGGDHVPVMGEVADLGGSDADRQRQQVVALRHPTAIGDLDRPRLAVGWVVQGRSQGVETLADAPRRGLRELRPHQHHEVVAPHVADEGLGVVELVADRLEHRGH